MRTWKASKLARDTHILERAEVGIGENMESNRLVRDTHHLERAEVGIGENIESKQASKEHSLSREGRG